ncbi:MAG: PEP-CTERM sorting domain-containing protein [Burkholderiaceae bacterium]
MKLSTLFVTSAIGCLFASTGQANVVTHTGDTTFAPTYNRLAEDLSGLSAVATAVGYNAYNFSVSTAGAYSFLTTGTYDTLSFLYSPSFNSTLATTNAKVANDDLFSFGTSGFSYDLLPGVNYSLVTTGFANNDKGVFSATIGGGGTITPAVVEGAAVTSPLITTITGNTTAAATFDRPIQDLSMLSTTGTAVGYDTYKFRVSTSGAYSFLTTGGYDTFDFLYSPTLDPLNPLTGALIANDDLLTIGTSGFLYNLIAGVDYAFVTTGFDNASVGFHSTTIGGPGSVIPIVAAVPEPEVIGLMTIGLVVLGAMRRRKGMTA